MSLIQNDFGEFVTQADYDPDLNRAKAYKSCIDVDVGKLYIRDVKFSKEKRLPAARTCQECGAEYQPVQYNQKFCSIQCQRADYLKRRKAKRCGETRNGGSSPTGR